MKASLIFSSTSHSINVQKVSLSPMLANPFPSLTPPTRSSKSSSPKPSTSNAPFPKSNTSENHSCCTNLCSIRLVPEHPAHLRDIRLLRVTAFNPLSSSVVAFGFSSLRKVGTAFTAFTAQQTQRMQQAKMAKMITMRCEAVQCVCWFFFCLLSLHYWRLVQGLFWIIDWAAGIATWQDGLAFGFPFE